MRSFEFINGRWVIEKHTESKLDYGFDWAATPRPWLKAGDTVVSAEWVLSPGLTKFNEGIDAQTVTWLEVGGGVLWALEWARVNIKTALGNEETETLYFQMVPQ